MTLKTETVPIAALKPYPRNPKRHDLEALRESVRLHGGQYRSVVVSSNNYILAGHGTIEALAAEGFTDVDVNRRPYKHTDPRSRKIVVADNHLPERGLVDNADLAALLTSLDGDLVGTGYEDDDLTRLLASLDPIPPPVPESTYKEQFAVLVICRNETHQADIYEKLQAAGFEHLKVVTT